MPTSSINKKNDDTAQSGDVNASATSSNNTEQSVIDYLKLHPDFFIEHNHLLVDLKVSQNLPSGVTSFIEKQGQVLRAQHDALKVQLQNLTDISQENEGYWTTLKQLCVFALVNKNAIINNPTLLVDWLKSHYKLSIICLKLPEHALANIGDEKMRELFRFNNAEVKKELLNRINSGHSYCDNRLPKQIKKYLFAENVMRAESCALLPLNIDRINNVQQPSLDKGIFVFADQDENRFNNHVDMTYLNMLSEILSATFALEKKPS